MKLKLYSYSWDRDNVSGYSNWEPKDQIYRGAIEVELPPMTDEEWADAVHDSKLRKAQDRVDRLKAELTMAQDAVKSLLAIDHKK